MSLPSPTRVIARNYNAFHAAQEATKVKAELLRVHLTEADGRVTSKLFDSHFFYGFSSFTPFSYIVRFLWQPWKRNSGCCGTTRASFSITLGPIVPL